MRSNYRLCRKGKDKDFSKELSVPVINGIAVSNQYVPSLPVVLHVRLINQSCHMQQNETVRNEENQRQ